jgi:hypothetical protein
MTEAAVGYISIEMYIIVLAEATYPVTYQYLDGKS